MKNKTTKIKILFLTSLLFLFSCSTKKKAWTNRTYHNITAKYNGYFNGKESLKEGVKKIKENHTDDYSKYISLYRYHDLKKEKKGRSSIENAIKKGSVVIQRHSINIKGKEYCKWIDDSYMLVGKAYFYKGEFSEAIKTFLFVKNEYKNNKKMVASASIWLVRSYTEKEDFVSAETELMELEQIRGFPKELKKDLLKTTANFYLKQKNFQLAIDPLKKLEKQIKRKNKKSRINFLLAQIYQQRKNYKEAKKYYQNVLRASVDYEMKFNSKINLGRSLENGNKEAEKIKEQLLKMTRDDKNKEYLDQIYYTIGEIEINNNDTSSAIESFEKSTINSTNNFNQKAKSFLALGNIEYTRSKYERAKIQYDSTLFYIDTDTEQFKKTKKINGVLTKLVENQNIVLLEDSLQELSRLPKNELLQKVNEIIRKEAEIAREKKEAEIARRSLNFENRRNQSRSEQFGNNTSGGKWYFYNPATLSFGMSEFRKKWGKRKLEDDWRRKNKSISNETGEDTVFVEKETNELTDKNNPKYYLESIPKNEKELTLSNKKILEALYTIGVIYSEQLEEKNKANRTFEQMIKRFPQDTVYGPSAQYYVFTNNKVSGHLKEAEENKKKLIKNYPKSIYAKHLKNPNYQQQSIANKKQKESEYKTVLDQYFLKKYSQILTENKNLKNSEYSEKYIFLKALAQLKTGDTLSFMAGLKKIKQKKGSLISETANYLLETIKNPSTMSETNEMASSGFEYLYRTNTPHMAVYILPKKDADISLLKTLVSDFNSSSFPSENLEISAMIMGKEKHLLIIKGFETPQTATNYKNQLEDDNDFSFKIKNKNHHAFVISNNNFKTFYKNKDIDGYNRFYTKKYTKTN